jgi:hypothetical protein
MLETNSTGVIMARLNLENKQFGKWFVIKRYSKIGASNVTWLCRCACGEEKPVHGPHLYNGLSISCRKCSEKKDKKKLLSRIVSRIIRGAKIRNLPINLGSTRQEMKTFLYELLNIKQKGKCALSGLSIVTANTNNGDMHGETTASLDRIDSKKGYTVDNVQWVHKDINWMKLNHDQNYFIKLCKTIAEYSSVTKEED